MRAELDSQRARRVRHDATVYGNVKLKLTGAFVCNLDTPNYLYLDANGADRDVFLPPIIPAGGQDYIITNTSNFVGSNYLRVRDSGGTLLTSIGALQTKELFSSPTSWQIVSGGDISV